MIKIPLHSIVMIIGYNSKDKRYLVKNCFQENEIISKEKISNLYFGDNTNCRPEFVLSEYLNLINSKLSFGERVVLTDNFFTEEERMFFITLAKKYNVKIYYVLTDKITNESSISYGDDGAVVLSISDNFDIVSKYKSPVNMFELKTKGFDGVTVVPDVHGDITSFRKAVAWAKSRKHLLVILGDIVDYGDYSIECISLAYELVTKGKAIFVRGNHERKLDHWFLQNDKNKQTGSNVNNNITNSNQKTIEQLENLSEEEFEYIKYKFFTIMNLSANHWLIEDFLFTHGACEPEMFSIYNKNLHGRLEKMALFGEMDYNKKDSYYKNRIYKWVNRIPHNKIVFVGHDIRSYQTPYFVENSYGGQVYFLDTGCSKNGKLTTADITIQDNVLTVTNFNVHVEEK